MINLPQIPIFKYCSNDFIKKLGDGSYGEVHLDVKGNAVKFFSGNIESYKDYEFCLLTEMSAMVVLREYAFVPKIKEIYFDKCIGYSMDFYSGGTLNENIRSNLLELKQNLNTIIYKIVFTLAYAQGMGILHRDVKSSNILFGKDICDVVLADWGICLQKIGISIGNPNQIVQTVWYRCPEQLLKVSEYVNNMTIDMWSVGIVMLEIISGQCGILQGKDELEMISVLLKKFGLDKTDTYIYSKLEKFLKNNKIESVNEYKSMDLSYVDEICDKHSYPIFCASFIKSCLQWSPTNRLTPVEALNHPFLMNSSKIDLKSLIKTSHIDKIITLTSFFPINFNIITQKNPQYLTKSRNFILSFFKQTCRQFQMYCLCVMYSDKIAENTKISMTYNINIEFVCSIYFLVYGLVTGETLTPKYFESMIRYATLSHNTINKYFKIIIRHLKFPLSIKTFAIYEDIFYKNSALKCLFRTLCEQIVDGSSYSNLQCEEILLIILKEMVYYCYLCELKPTYFFSNDITTLISKLNIFDTEKTLSLKEVSLSFNKGLIKRVDNP
jgi:serine/threonine protein kinase